LSDSFSGLYFRVFIFSPSAMLGLHIGLHYLAYTILWPLSHYIIQKSLIAWLNLLLKDH